MASIWPRVRCSSPKVMTCSTASKTFSHEVWNASAVSRKDGVPSAPETAYRLLLIFSFSKCLNDAIANEKRRICPCPSNASASEHWPVFSDKGGSIAHQHLNRLP